MNKLIIAYCIENQIVAAKVVAALKDKMDVEKVVFDEKNGIEILKKTANGNAFPVLLLISDNFLKSENCMNGSLAFIQSLGSSKRLIPVTTDGVYTDSVSGKVSTVPTSFDRVSNVIQFMNYWQDRYLELRKLKDEGDESANNEIVRIVRAISSEIGELLRYFRTIEFYSFDQFIESNYIILYRILNLDAPKQEDVKSPIAVSHTVMPTQNTEVAYSNGIKTPLSTTVEEEPPVNLSDIPGIAQLNERMNMHDSSIGTSQDAVVIPKDNESPKLENDIQIAPQYTIKEENKIEETPSEIQRSEVPFTLESLIQDIRTDKNYQVLEDRNISPLKSESDDTNIQAEQTDELDKPAASVISGLTLEQLVKDGELKENMGEQTHYETIESMSNHADETTELTNDAHNTGLLGDDEEELVKAIAAEAESEKHVEMPLAAASLDNIIEKTDDELSNETMDEADVLQEVARVFDEAEQLDPNFDFESQLTQVVDNQENNVDNTEGGTERPVVQTLQASLAAEPFNNALRYQLASELTNQNRYAEATEQLDILLDNDRTNVDAYILLAYLAEQQSDFILSLNSLEKVTLLNPDYPGIYYKLGRLTNDHFKKQDRKALRYFREAVAQDPTNADAQYHYAVAMVEQRGDFKTAIEHLHTAAELAPQRDDVTFELAKAYFEINDKANAAQYYARATEMNAHHKTDSNDQLFYYEEPVIEVIPEIIDNGIAVLITGATSGIGKATAAIFAKNGYRLILTGRRSDRLEALKTAFEEEYHNRIQILNFDVRSIEDMKKSLAELDEDFKNVDILINNAGLASGFAPIHEGDIEDWDKMIDTNIKGLLYMTRAIAPQMVARRKGHIVNIGSIAGKEIYPNGNIYSATKFAVDALTRAMRVDMHKYNIRVSQVSPGAVEETEFAMVRFHGDVEKASIYKDFTPLKASDVAETIYFMVTRPEYVNIQDVVMMGTQQGSANHFDRSGRTDVGKE